MGYGGALASNGVTGKGQSLGLNLRISVRKLDLLSVIHVELDEYGSDLPSILLERDLAINWLG